MNFRAGTLNVLNGSCRWEERMPLVKQLIERMDCDLLGVQEVHKALSWAYFPELPSRFFPVQEPLELYGEPTFHIDGNAAFVKPPFEIVSSEGYDFQTKKRSAGRLQLSNGERTLHFVVVHLDYALPEVSIPFAFSDDQVQELLAFLSPILSEDIVLAGDFNFQPTTAAYARITKVFKSAYREKHGKEPVITFPTGLTGKYMDMWMSGTFDYVFYRGNLEVTNSRLHGSEVVTTEGLWPSDHYAVTADFRFI